jgi:ABC-type Fe3+/spermidine/putrescine transport system ATPase subunit
MIRLRNVSRRWPDFAIRDVSLEVAPGEYVAIVGPTGAGKTLLLELLLGMHAPDSGRIEVAGADVTGLPPEARGIGMVYQDYALFPHLDVQKNLAFGLRYRRASATLQRSQVLAIARRLGIEHLLARMPATLSGGERQRTALGRALVTEPRVLLLDEPLSALDRGTAARLRDELRALHANQRLTVLHVTHDLAEARELAQRVVLLHDGAVHGDGTVDELLRRPATRFAATFVGAVNVFEASLAHDGDRRAWCAGPIRVPAGDATGGAAHVLVHPDEAVLVAADARGAHVVRGEIAALRDEGHHVAVLVRVDGLPAPLTVWVGRGAARAGALQLGQPVAADLAHAIHVLYEPAP